MPELLFHVEGGGGARFAAAPLMMFQVRISTAEQIRIASVALRCQIQIEAARRQYDAGEQAELKELFGEPERWGETLRTLLWAHSSLVVPEFTGSTVAEIPVPCTFDLNLAVVKYFHGLKEGEIPLCFQFSGSIFYEDADGRMQVSPIPWSKEARYRMPLASWQDMMQRQYPNTGWLTLRRDVIDRLYRYKVQRGIPTWEQTFEKLLGDEEMRAKA